MQILNHAFRLNACTEAINISNTFIIIPKHFCLLWWDLNICSRLGFSHSLLVLRNHWQEGYWVDWLQFTSHTWTGSNAHVHVHTHTHALMAWDSGHLALHTCLSHIHTITPPPPPSTQLPLETGRQHTHCPVTYSGRPTCTITSRCVTSRVARTCWCPQTHSSSPSSVAAVSVCLCVSSTRSSFSSLIRNLENLQDLFWFSAHDWK